MVYPFFLLVKSKTGSFRALSGSFGVFHSGALRAQKKRRPAGIFHPRVVLDLSAQKAKKEIPSRERIPFEKATIICRYTAFSQTFSRRAIIFCTGGSMHTTALIAASTAI